MSFILRDLAAQDLDPMLRMAAASAEAPQWTRPDYEKILLGPSADPVARYGVVAVRPSCREISLAGFAVATWLRQEAAEIESLVVEQGYRRRGIGTALVAACKDWAAKAGAASIRLEVRASNVAALGLYHRHGFTSIGLRRAYYTAPVEDALLLEAPLLSSRPL